MPHTHTWTQTQTHACRNTHTHIYIYTLSKCILLAEGIKRKKTVKTHTHTHTQKVTTWEKCMAAKGLEAGHRASRWHRMLFFMHTNMHFTAHTQWSQHIFKVTHKSHGYYQQKTNKQKNTKKIDTTVNSPHWNWHIWAWQNTHTDILIVTHSFASLNILPTCTWQRMHYYYHCWHHQILATWAWSSIHTHGYDYRSLSLINRVTKFSQPGLGD